MTERVANQTSSMVQNLAEMIFRSFQNESLSMIKVSKRATEDLIRGSKENIFKERSLEGLEKIAGPYGTGKVDIDKNIYGMFIEFAKKHNLPFAKDEIEDGYIIYYLNKDRDTLSSLGKYITNKKDIKPNDIYNLAKTTKSREVIKINNLSQDELELIDVLKNESDLKYAKIDNGLLIVKDHYETFLNEYKEINALLNSKEGVDLVESLKNKRLTNEIINYKERKDIVRNKNFIIIDAADPDRKLDIYKEKHALLDGADRLNSEDVFNIANRTRFFTAPLAIDRDEYKKLKEVDVSKQLDYLNNKVKYIQAKNSIKDIPKEEKERADIRLNIQKKKLKRNKVFSKKEFDKILRSDPKKEAQTQTRIRERERWQQRD